jgi:glycosyltransferase involved in cell wall biosynthesis
VIPQKNKSQNSMSKRIKVVIDTRDLRIAKTGAKTYLEEICREFKKGDPGFTFYFVDTWLPVYTGNNKVLKIIEHIRFFTWKQLALPVICFARGCDILYCTDYFLPLIKLNYKTAVVFYDAFFWEYPEQYNFLWLRLLNTIGVAAAKRADAVITITHYSKQQIVKYVGIAAEKIHAIHLAPKSTRKNLDTANALSDPTKKYILHLGVLEKRKNLLNLIMAFHLLLAEGYEDYYLVLAGSSVAKEKIDDSANIRNLVKKLDLEERVILTGFISDEHLAHYYKNATVYAFVSINEGFGLPVLEAFQNNLPTLISDNSCLPEVGGDAVITCDPFNITDIKNKLKLIIDNPSLQSQLIEKGHKRLTLFSWQNSAGELLNVFKEISK